MATIHCSLISISMRSTKLDLRTNINHIVIVSEYDGFRVLNHPRPCRQWSNIGSFLSSLASWVNNSNFVFVPHMSCQHVVTTLKILIPDFCCNKVFVVVSGMRYVFMTRHGILPKNFENISKAMGKNGYFGQETHFY